MRKTLIPVLALFLSACGAPPGRTGPIGHRPPPDSRPAPGTLKEAEIAGVLRDSQAGFNNCYKRAAGSFVGGQALLEFEVSTSGRVLSVRVKASDLGSLAVEDCLLQVARFLEFPAPEGGEARFAVPFEHNLAGRRLSTAVDLGFGYQTLRQAQPEIRECRRLHGFDAPFHVTVFIGRLGQVMSAGFESDALPPESFPACVVQRLEMARFPDPGARLVKYRALVEDLPEGTDPRQL